METIRPLTLLVVVIADLALAISVLLRNRSSVAHRAFAASTLAIVCWLTLDYLCDQPALLPQALLLNRLAVASGLAMGALLLYFTLVFPQREHRLSLAWRAFMAVGAGLVGLTVATEAMVARVEAESWGTNIVPGPLLPLAAVWAILGTLAAVVVLVDKYRRAGGLQRAQLKYMVLGISLFAIVSLILGLVLPMATGSYELARLNALATLLMVGSIAYAMMRYRLMDIRFVVLRGAAYVLLVTILGVGFVSVVALLRTGLAEQTKVNADAVFVITALAGALGFQPLRRMLERATDRIFYRETYVPTELLSRLGVSMASTIDLPRLCGVLTDEVAKGMRLSFATVVFYHEGSPQVVGPSDLSDEDAQRLLALTTGSNLVVADELEPTSSAHRLLSDLSVRVLAPLIASDAVLGTLVLGPKLSGETYSPQDIGLLEVLVSEASIAMKNALLFDEKNQRVRELTALNELAFALSSNRELDTLLASALEQVVSVTGADSGSILLLQEETDTLTIAAAVGIPHDIVASTHIPVGEGIAGWVAECKEPLVLVDNHDPRFAGELLREDVGSAICAPVLSKDEVIGVLNVNRKGGSDLFTTENMHVVTSFAGQLGIAIENARLYTNLESTFLGTISALAAAVDAKDPYTFGHSNEVTIHAVRIAEELGLDADEVQMIRIAATLHDIGKIGIDGAILLKPGKLTAEEREIINRHPAIGADILAPLDFLRDTVPLVLFHHERYGGGGYPSGISGEAIPFGARIISVADSFNAMVSDRPYREGLSLEAAMRELRENSGSQFDPIVVDSFLKLLNEGAIVRRPELPVAPSPGWQFDKPPLQS